jgi:hypothetical protein
MVLTGPGQATSIGIYISKRFPVRQPVSQACRYGIITLSTLAVLFQAFEVIGQTTTSRSCSRWPTAARLWHLCNYMYTICAQ